MIDADIGLALLVADANDVKIGQPVAVEVAARLDLVLLEIRESDAVAGIDGDLVESAVGLAEEGIAIRRSALDARLPLSPSVM